MFGGLLQKNTNTSYTPTSSSDSDASDLEKRDLLRSRLTLLRDSLEDTELQRRPWRRRLWTITSTFLNILLLILLLAVTLRGHQIEQDYNNNTDNILSKKTSIYSPILDTLPITYTNTYFNGFLFDSGTNASIYRQPPSPAVDAAWERISDVGPFVVSRSTITKIGKDPKTCVKMPISWGYGNDAYYAQPDSFHQIHCLNVLRRSVYLYRPYYEKQHHGHNGGQMHEHSKDPKVEEAHIQHCIYTLLQSLKCAANTDVITHNWVKGQIHPYPDFKVLHRCRNFDDLLEWYEANRIDIKGKTPFTRPEDGDYVELPAPEEQGL